MGAQITLLSDRPEAKRVTPTDVDMVEKAEVCLISLFFSAHYLARNYLGEEQGTGKKSLRLLSERRPGWIISMSINSSGEILRQ